MNLNKEELTVLLQILNMPRQQDLKTAQFCISLNNKLSKMINEIELKEPITAKKEKKPATPEK